MGLIFGSLKITSKKGIDESLSFVYTASVLRRTYIPR